MSPEPFKISIPESDIADLKSRLALASFPSELDGAGWDYGASLPDVKRLTGYWRDQFDWRRTEKRLNETLPQFTTHVGLDNGFGTLKVHFVHQKSGVDGAIPLLFVHGWPGSFIEVSKLLPDLLQGDDDSPAFHVVALSLPNFGFSEGSTKRGFGISQYAEIANKLMIQLGYNEYVTQGGDWGFFITRMLSNRYPQHCKANHFNMVAAMKPQWTKHPLLALRHAVTPYTTRDKEAIARTEWFVQEGRGYAVEQATKPQTIGYALADSPIALLAWIYEKLHGWADAYPWTEDEVCTWVSIYWFSVAGPASSLRIYYESAHLGDKLALQGWIPNVKLGVTHFPKELRVVPKMWAYTLGPVVFESENLTGGHFAAWEHPEIIVRDLKRMFGKGGGAYNVVKGKNGFQTAPETPTS